MWCARNVVDGWVIYIVAIVTMRDFRDSGFEQIRVRKAFRWRRDAIGKLGGLFEAKCTRRAYTIMMRERERWIQSKLRYSRFGVNPHKNVCDEVALSVSLIARPATRHHVTDGKLVKVYQYLISPTISSHYSSHRLLTVLMLMTA